jgi:hypothetical protein
MIPVDLQCNMMLLLNQTASLVAMGVHRVEYTGRDGYGMTARSEARQPMHGAGSVAILIAPPFLNQVRNFRNGSLSFEPR